MIVAGTDAERPFEIAQTKLGLLIFRWLGVRRVAAGSFRIVPLAADDEKYRQRRDDRKASTFSGGVLIHDFASSWPKGNVTDRFWTEASTDYRSRSEWYARTSRYHIPDLHGRLVILDESNTIIAVFGYNSDPKKRVNFNVPQERWIEGVFSGTHGPYWDKDGNLYFQDWNVSGRIIKLVQIK